ncbi:hypothetical protein Bpfe_021969 [Biomphalaria pfeifferi]|uniref:Uncharacterized protein n=1 Tax=Biomphalaria pfeifferi TaxID=112525 RepID=A0AAD8B5R6_BIOPF|nr:hypothetical protein Bpfe_021969 [Biomphalaria pfeifferi]
MSEMCMSLKDDTQRLAELESSAGTTLILLALHLPLPPYPNRIENLVMTRTRSLVNTIGMAKELATSV